MAVQCQCRCLEDPLSSKQRSFVGSDHQHRGNEATGRREGLLRRAAKTFTGSNHRKCLIVAMVYVPLAYLFLRGNLPVISAATAKAESIYFASCCERVEVLSLIYGDLCRDAWGSFLDSRTHRTMSRITLKTPKDIAELLPCHTWLGKVGAHCTIKKGRMSPALRSSNSVRLLARSGEG